MTASRNVRIGLAGWANPPHHREQRGDGESHLSYYARHFNFVEINSSFYRPHLAETYQRWRQETPAGFRFSAKMPKSITHELRLRRSRQSVTQFFDQVAQLQPKLAAVLIQLPPSLEYDSALVRSFFRNLPALGGTAFVCEPRHSSWFTERADDALARAEVVRVAADPARSPGAADPGGLRHRAYFRWHGSPRIYYSSYEPPRLAELALQVQQACAKSAWCVFDNTARYAAWEDALKFITMLGRKNKRLTNVDRDHA